MRVWVVVLGMLCITSAQAQWQPSAGHQQIAIWPGPAPDPQPVAGPEREESSGSSFLVAGRPIVEIANVTRPTMTVYPALGKNTGAAVVVFPGGGYQVLAIDLEGSEVCDWLVTRGITCILLKYRVTSIGDYAKSGPWPESKMALEDAQRTLRLVRAHAREWNLDPHKIGVLGFSAGGHLVAAMATLYDQRLYSPVDAADQQSCRPDFGIAIYPGHLSLAAADYDAHFGKKKWLLPGADSAPGFPWKLRLNPFLPVTRNTPPMFLVQAEDDHTDSVYDSLAFYIALQEAGVPAEMHLYAHGGHAFGLRPTGNPITRWPELAQTWLKTIGVLTE